MKGKMSTVDLLRHSRHDWLNKLQMIKGNLSLQRYDRVDKIIEEIMIESRNEGKLTSLNMPRFAEFLMTYNWFEPMFRLDFEIFGDERDLSISEEDILNWCNGFFDELKEAVTPYGENYISLSIEVSEQTVSYIIDIQADLQDQAPIEAWLLDKKQFGYLQLKKYSLTKNECTIQLQAKC